MSTFIMPALLLGLILGTFWLYVYCYGLYRLGRVIALRYRTRPVATFSLIALASAILALGCLLIPVDIIWKSAIVFGVWITHTQAIGAGFWGGIDLGKRADEVRFRKQAEDWLREWEEPVPKNHGEETDP